MESFALFTIGLLMIGGALPVWRALFLSHASTILLSH
jgi:hypothetical protein